MKVRTCVAERNLGRAPFAWLLVGYLRVASLVGGMRSLTGACAGVAVVSVVAEAFRAAERGVEIGGHVIEAPSGLQEIALSVILLAILILRPNGLAGDEEISLLTTKEERGA